MVRAMIDTAPAINILDSIDPERLKRALGVSEHSIRHARFTKAMPANWFSVVSALCDEKGIDCPHAAFNFRSPSSSPASVSED